MELPRSEEQRLRIQESLDLQKTSQERNRLGQFATPGPLANEIIFESARHIDPHRLAQPVKFLDPAIGTGAFWSALKTVRADLTVQGVGIEIDKSVADASRRLWTSTGLKVRCADFTQCPAPASEPERFDLVVCNPPYVRHHHIAKQRKTALRRASAGASGIDLSGLAGLYCHFLALTHPWMRRGAIAAWLIPSEFMDVNYGTTLKRYLLQQVSLLRVHQFDPDDTQFEDALVSSALLIFRNEPPRPKHKAELTRGAQLGAPTSRRDVAVREILPDDRWTQLCAGLTRRPPAQAGTKSMQLRDLFTIRRGLVTGGNKFFVLPERQARELQLPSEHLTPILPSPRYLPQLEVMARPDGAPDLPQRRFLINCRLPQENVQQEFPELWRYLCSAPETVRAGYICKNRSPWYRQERRPPAPLICTYLGRPAGQRRPFRFILNHSRATAANVYHLLYPLPRLASAIEFDPSLLPRIWRYLNTMDVDHLLRESRVYGGGLHKLEPAELGRISLDDLDADLRDLPELIVESVISEISELPPTQLNHTPQLLEPTHVHPPDSSPA